MRIGRSVYVCHSVQYSKDVSKYKHKVQPSNSLCWVVLLSDYYTIVQQCLGPFGPSLPPCPPSSPPPPPFTFLNFSPVFASFFFSFLIFLSTFIPHTPIQLFYTLLAHLYSSAYLTSSFALQLLHSAPLLNAPPPDILCYNNHSFFFPSIFLIHSLSSSFFIPYYISTYL